MKQPNHRKALTLLLGLIVALGSSPFLSADDTAGKNRQKWWEDTEVQSAASLSADQVARIAEIEADFGPKVSGAVKEAGKIYNKTLAMVKNGTCSGEEYEAQIASLEEAYARHAAISAQRWCALRAVVSTEQWVSLTSTVPRLLRLGGFMSRSGVKRLALGPNAATEGGPGKK